MFRESNISLFLLCLLPVVLYSIIIFLNSPSFSIRLKAFFVYLYTGLLSVTLLQFIHFIFPHIGDTFFKIHLGNFDINDTHFEIYQPTLASLLLFAFIQVALLEEFSKWIAFKCANYMRGKRRKNSDHPYASMFYCALISAAFSIVENIQYAERAITGEFGSVTPESILIVRSVSSVIVHMACGLFMGYYISRGNGTSKIKKILYNIIGIAAATFIHGIYDFSWFKPGAENDYKCIFGHFQIHVPSAIIIAFSLAIAFFMAWHLKYIKQEEIKKQ